MEVSKALYISQEIHPYLNASTMSELSRAVAQSLQEKGIEVRTFMPKYGCINERRNQLHEVIRLSGINLIINDTDHPLIIKVATLLPTRMQVYFIDNDDYFHHHASTELEIDTHPEDNDERVMFFSRGVVETVRKLRWYPSIVHCSGWITALCPLYIKTKYADDPAFKNGKVVYSVFGNTMKHNITAEMMRKIAADGIAEDDMKALATGGEIDFGALNRLGIDHADAVVIATSDVDADLIEYIKASGKPYLEFPGEGNMAAYMDFYASL